MTNSRPAAPESETPRNWRKIVDDTHPTSLEPFYSNWIDDLTKFDLHGKADIATVLSLLEREFSLAQTEIKGLKHDIARHLAICSEQATRIAELEKALAAHGTDAPGGIFS